jgi:hypothetical protein
MLSGIMLSVITPSIIMLSVVVPHQHPCLVFAGKGGASRCLHFGNALLQSEDIANFEFAKFFNFIFSDANID